MKERLTCEPGHGPAPSIPDRSTKTDVARALREMALFLEMDGVPFKPQAYEKAAYAIAALDAVLGIGKGIAVRIAGMLETGQLADLEALREAIAFF